MGIETATILWNEPAGPDIFHMGLQCGATYRHAIPGQFVMINTRGGSDPLLSRPFSIHRLTGGNSDSGGVEILYKRVGRVTGTLAALTVGERLSLVGPLGNGFPDGRGDGRIFLVAGGIGVAPMAFLMDRLIQDHQQMPEITLFLGGRTRGDLLCRDLFEKQGLPVVAVTEDGSIGGDPCLVTRPLERAVRQQVPDRIFACGPRAMLACVADIAAVHGVRCHVSVETVMACGIGACMGCAVERGGQKAGFVHACKDGPVFEAGAIKW